MIGDTNSSLVIARHASISLRGVLTVARRSRSKLEHEIPRFTRNKLRNLRGGHEIATPSARNDSGGKARNDSGGKARNDKEVFLSIINI